MRVSSPDHFRAPPPSPVASSRRASFTANDDVLSEFLDKCGRVPNLVLPDKVFPKHTFLVNPPTFDFLRLGSSLSALLDAISTIGCFQLINHGVPEATVKAAMENTNFHDETEEIVLYKDMVDDQMKACYADLRELMGEAERIGKAMREKLRGRRSQEEEEDENDEEEGVGACYVKKHNNKNETKEEAIRMLIRGYDERHSLCLNFCCNAEFHVYSKRGWVSFSPRTDAVIVTVGDEGWCGKFKSVVGKPLLYKSNVNPHFISISFLYTTVTHHNNTMGITEKKNKKKKNIISFSHQLYFALFLTILFPFFLR